MTIIYTKNTSRKKLSKKALRLREERKALFKQILKGSDKSRPVYAPEPYVKKELPPLSNSVGNGYKRSVDDYKWKKGREEQPSTIKEIEKKKTRLAPIYSKGPVQYLTEGIDPDTLGKKV